MADPGERRPCPTERAEPVRWDPIPEPDVDNAPAVAGGPLASVRRRSMPFLRAGRNTDE